MGLLQEYEKVVLEYPLMLDLKILRKRTAHGIDNTS